MIEAKTPSEADFRALDPVTDTPSPVKERGLTRLQESSLARPNETSTSISTKVSQPGLNHLILNIVIPGLGSLAHGKRSLGISQMLLALASLPLFLYHLYFGLPLLLGAYVWSIASGSTFLKEEPEWE